MIGAKTGEGCTDFNLDAEIWVVGFRERLVACARSSGQIRVSGAPWCARRSLRARPPSQSLFRLAPPFLHRFWSGCLDFRSSGSEGDGGSGRRLLQGRRAVALSGALVRVSVAREAFATRSLGMSRPRLLEWVCGRFVCGATCRPLLGWPLIDRRDGRRRVHFGTDCQLARAFRIGHDLSLLRGHETFNRFGACCVRLALGSATSICS
jgi:hypothetical protein